MDLRILGPLEVRRGEELLTIPGHKARTLLACLVVNSGHPVSRDRLIDAIWGEFPPRSAVNTLHTYVTHLRGALDLDHEDTHIQRHPNGYALALAEDEVDAWRLESALATARLHIDRRDFRMAVSLLERAIGEWRGPPLEEFLDCEFAVLEAHRLEDLRVTAEQLRAASLLASGEAARAVEILDPLLAELTYREDLWEAYMLGLYRLGRQADSLEAFRRLRRELGEIGLEPSQPLVDLETRILERDPSLLDLGGSEAGPRVGPVPVPRPSDFFVGRASDMEELRQLEAENRLLTLTGIGGVGKSRLALEFIASSESIGRYVDLATISDEGTALTRIAEAFGLTEKTRPQLAELVSDSIGERPVTLLVDNAEHLARPIGPILRDLIGRSDRLRVLVTSREPLGVPGEVAHVVAPLDFGAEPFPSDAELLFLKRSRIEPAGGPDFEAVTSICRAVNGIPAAVEVMAGAARVLSLEELAENLDTLLSDEADRQSLPQILDWSFGAMSHRQRDLFQAASLFVDGFPFDALVQVAGRWADLRGVLDDLGALVDRSLLAVEKGPPTRYRILDVFRQRGVEHLETSRQSDEVRARFVSYFADMATDLEEAFGTERWQPTLNRVDSEEANATEALKLAITDGVVQSAYRIAGPLGRYWRWRGRAIEGVHRLTEVAALEGADDVDRAKVQRELAGLHRTMGDIERSMEHAREALALYDGVGSRPGRADALYDLGLGEIFAGNFSEAENMLEESASIWKELDERSLSSFPMIPLAWLAMLHGEYDKAEAMWTATLARVDTALFPEHSGITFRVAELALAQGQIDRARRIARDALDAALRARYPYHEAGARGVLARIHLELGDSDEAASETELAMEAARGSGNVEGLAQAFLMRGRLALGDDNVPEALRALHGLLSSAGHIAGPLSAATLAGLGARVQMSRGEWDDAAALFAAERSIRSAHSLPLSHPDRVDTEASLALVKQALGEERFAQAFHAGSLITEDRVRAMLAGWFERYPGASS